MSISTGCRNAYLKDLIGQMGTSELSDWRPDIVRIPEPTDQSD